MKLWTIAESVGSESVRRHDAARCGNRLVHLGIWQAFVLVSCATQQPPPAPDWLELPVDSSGRLFSEAEVVRAGGITPERQECPPPSTRSLGTVRESIDSASVEFRFVVSTDGVIEPGSLKVESATQDQFIDAARSMIARCRFRPGIVQGQRVRVQMAGVPIAFRLGPRP